jgi:hypothetical protein
MRSLPLIGCSLWRLSGEGGASEILGMKRSTLQSKTKQLGIKRPAG